MSGGLKPGHHFLIVVVIGVLASLGLYMLPKTVVNNEKKPEEQPAISKSSEESHVLLSPEQNEALNLIRTSNLSELDKIQSLSEFFKEQSFFDSAGYYANLWAGIKPSQEAWLKAGDLYYQAYSLTLNPVNRENLGESARLAYQKVLEINPHELHARTNSAMTYSTSNSPMQAIMMLRQVLEENPKYLPAIMSMGALSMQSGQYDRAISRFEQVLVIDPSNLNAKLGLAYSLIEVGETQKAKTLLQEISKEDVGEVLQNEITNTLKSLN